jgi:hypothetical protein
MIPELTDFQTNVLLGTANGASRVCALILPGDNDEKERKEKLAEQVRDIDELIEWGLMKDISDEFTEQIKLAKLNYKVDSKVVIITEQAELMFRDAGQRTVN